MSFRQGHYDFLLSSACVEKFDCVCDDLRRCGVSRSEFIRALRRLRAEIQLGHRLPDLTTLARPDEFGVTIFGYRIHIHVDQALFAITIVDIDEP